MKVMDESTETKDCTITMTVPPKKKKLVQARLPFQMLGSSATPNTLSTKKRKQMSPSPTDCRSPKIVKITTKENSEQKKISESTVDNDNESKGKSEDVEENSTIVCGEPLEQLTEEVEKDETVLSNKKVDGKSQTKPCVITQFFRKVNPPSTTRNMPVVVLRRCDESNDENESSSHASTNVENVENDEELVVTKSDESSNDELAKELEDSEAEEDAVAKEGSDASSDNHAGNSDSDSEPGISSSDDETDEHKGMKDDESKDKKTVNGKSIDKTPTSGVKPESGSAARRRLTPKQLEKKMESTKRQEERRMEKIEKEKKREEERLNRQKEKEARRREKKEKEEAEKEQKKKEKEQKELKKQMEIEQKQKEKERRDKAKEEDRKKREEAKEEEKRKKEEERLEAERKKQKAASTFVSFFVPKKTETKVTEEKKLPQTSNFMPFQVKADMRVAPICRRILNNDEKTKFDSVCIDKLDDKDRLYVNEIKDASRQIRKSVKTWPPESKDDDVVVVEEDDVGSCDMVDQSRATIEKQRAKLLAFAENQRPPYWGTWRKRSTIVRPRRPFSRDTKWFDYDVDSDEEWEEEEPGESLRGSDDEKDDEKDEENPDDDEYDVDNEFMVPHGYLSDEEARADEDEEDMSPETQKFKLKILGEEFEAERKEQTLKIKPKVVGCIWQGPVNSYPENIPQKLVDFLMARQAWVRETPIMLASPLTAESTSATADSTMKNQSSTGDERRGPKKTRLVVPDEALPDLIRLIHGNTHGRGFLIKEFMTFWNRKKRDNANPLSKSSVNEKIGEFARRMACPEEGPMHLKACWYVSEEVRKNYLDDETLELPNRWNYALTPKRRTITEAPKIPEKPEKEEKEKEREKEKEKEKEKKSVPLITQYTKKITQEEMKKQLTTKTSQISSPKASTSQIKPHKRAQLISVARGEQFPKSPILDAFGKAQATINLRHDNAIISGKEIIDNSGKEPIATSSDDKMKMNESYKTTPMVVDLESSEDSTIE